MKSKKKKKYDITKDSRYITLNNKIIKNADKLWIPPVNPDFKCVNEDDTFFNIYKYNNNEEYKNITLKNKKKIKTTIKGKKKKYYKCMQVTLIFNNTQKRIIDNWLNSYITMYNKTLRYIKNIFNEKKEIKVDLPISESLKKQMNDIDKEIYKNSKNITGRKSQTVTSIKKIMKYPLRTKTNNILSNLINVINENKKIVSKEEIYNNITNFKFMRTYCLFDTKKEIIARSGISSLEYNTKVPSHILDGAIKLACANYKSAISNYIKGNIRHFRIRYWKYNKDSKIMDLEQQSFNEETMFPSIIENIKFKYDGTEYSKLKNIIYHNQEGKRVKLESIDCDSKLKYDKLTNRYYLFIPVELKKTIIKNANNIISIDPGVRNFINGISENGLIKIGEDVQNKIKEKLLRIDYINNEKNKMKNKKKKERNKRRQLKNLIDELHWKTINYLTKNYDKILIGDLSAKRISCKETSNIPKMTKRIAYSMSYYKFRQRLEYKCIIKELDYRKVHEAYTSKMCSICGSYNKDLGGNKIYKCINLKCNAILGRDDNGARDILLLETI
jgi:IS605 OrfB family transposase